MSNSLSNHFSPALLPLPTFPAWPPVGSALKARAQGYSHDVYKVWDNAFPFRREVGVEQIDQANAAPQSIVALTQSCTGLFAQELVIVKQRARQVVTAMRLLDDGVRLLSWRVNADGSLLRTGSSSLQLDAVQQIKMVHARNYLVACRTASGDVHLSRWDVSNTGAIYLAGLHHGCVQQVQWLEMVALTPELVVTFSLTTAQTWQLMLWQLQGDSDLHLLQRHEIPAAAVGNCALAVLPASGDTLRLATVVSESPTMLAFQLWHYTPGAALTLSATHEIPTPAAAAVMIAHVDHTHVRVAVQTITGQLHLLPLRLAAADQIVVNEPPLLLGEGVGQCACQPQAGGFSLFYQALAGVQQVQRWQLQPDDTLHRVGDGYSPATSLAEVTCCDEVLEGNAPFLTGVIDAQGEMILTTWR